MITLPEAIQEILEECRYSLTKQGDLTAPFRAKIYNNLSEFLPIDNNTIPHYWRAKLELKCALKVIEYWELCELTDGSARQLLYMADRYLQGEIDRKELEKTNHVFYDRVEDLMCHGSDYFIACYAGFACISAVNSALYDLNFETLGLPEIESDPDDWTACFYACASYCGGAIWEAGIGDDWKRREFWKWFLYDAVPTLWQI